MSEQQDDQSQDSGVRRVGKRDRQKRLEARTPLFPDDDEFNLDEDRFPPVNPVVPPESPPPTPGKRNYFVFNLIAVIFVLASIGVLMYYIQIAIDPYTPLNPFPPFTPLPIIITTTPLPPTETAIPTITPSPSFTPIQIEALITASVPPPTFPFTLPDEGIDYQTNTNDQGCNWSSIIVSVTDFDGEPVSAFGLRVVREDLNVEVPIDENASFASGEIELPLGETPENAPYTVQLLNATGIPLSEEYRIITSDRCEQNVITVRFVQQREF